MNMLKYEFNITLLNNNLIQTSYGKENHKEG